MATRKYEDVRKLLSTPLDFQEAYGDRPQTIANEEIHADSWRGLTFKGWTFESVMFEETHFRHCRFEGVTFRDCVFVVVGSNRCVFHDCQFEGCAIAGGDWTANTWRMGSFSHSHWLRDPLDRGVPVWKENRFEGTVLSGVSAEKRATHWISCAFTGTRIHEYQFSHLGMDDCLFQDTEFFHGDWSQTGTGSSRACTFRNVRFSENQIAQTFLGGVFEQVEFREPRGASLWGSFRGIVAHPGGNADFQEVDTARLLGRQGNVALERAKDVEIDEIGPQGRFFLGEGGAENVIVHGADLERAGFASGTYRNCRFENWVTKDFWMAKDATFVGCHFSNIRITREIVVSGPVHFDDCTFENMRRDPGAKSFLDDQPGDFRFPFELDGGSI